MGEDCLGGERGLHGVPGVERTQKVQGGRVAAEPAIRSVGLGGGKGLNNGAQGLVGEERVEGVFFGLLRVGGSKSSNSWFI